MKAVIILGTAILAVLFLGGISIDAKLSTRKSPADLDVKPPLLKLEAAYNSFKDKFDFPSVVKLIFSLIPCIIQLLVPPTQSFEYEAHITSLNLLLNDSSKLEFIGEQFSELPPVSSILFQDPPPVPFCKTPAFKSIHNFVWVAEEEKQLEDLIHFLGRFGYPEIYNVTKELYNATFPNCPELLLDLPKEPPQPSAKKSPNQITSTSSNIREEILEARKRSRKDEGKCDILDIISQIPDTGLIQLMNLVITATEQFNTNPSLQFLIGKIQEPAKGKSVRRFRELDAVKGLLVKAHLGLIANEKWNQFFSIIKQSFGIDFFTINPIDFLYSLVEFLVWRTPFPVPV